MYLERAQTFDGYLAGLAARRGNCRKARLELERSAAVLTLERNEELMPPLCRISHDEHETVGPCFRTFE